MMFAAILNSVSLIWAILGLIINISKYTETQIHIIEMNKITKYGKQIEI